MLLRAKDKILITGGGGQLAREVYEMFFEKKSSLGDVFKGKDEFEILSLTSKQLNIANKEEVFYIIKKEKPTVIINCAAYTDVDGCEEYVEKAFSVNAIGPRNLAIICEEENIKLVHISTDYVFSGEEKEEKIESDLVNPKTVYGKSKVLGETYVKNFCRKWFILRTSWLYGKYGKNFVKTIVKAAKEKKELFVVNDQFGSPTNAQDLSFAIAKLIFTEEYGLYHCSGNGNASWYDFACEIVKCFKINASVKPISSDEIKRKAKRPHFSKLNNLMLKLTVGDCFRDWKVALKDFSENVKTIF